MPITQLWHELTGAALEPGRVSITGDESVLPGPFRVAAAAAASVTAANLAAAELLRARDVDPGVVTVDTRHAAAAFRSERLLRIDGESPGDLFAPLSADYRAADGWVRLHCDYPHHAVAASRALGVPAERAALEAAVRSRRASDVQEAVIAAGGAAAAMRTRAEWHAHPQGAALRELPLAELRRLASTAPIPLPPGDRPLSGIKVLELTHVIAGPVCGRVLAAHGADVLHVGASHLPMVAPLVVDTGFGKRSAAIDLRDGEGRATLRELVREADVFVQSYRPGSLAAKGFAADMLAEAGPGIVAVDLSAYGWRAVGPPPWLRQPGATGKRHRRRGRPAGGHRCTPAAARTGARPRHRLVGSRRGHDSAAEAHQRGRSVGSAVVAGPHRVVAGLAGPLGHRRHRGPARVERAQESA